MTSGMSILVSILIGRFEYLNQQMRDLILAEAASRHRHLPRAASHPLGRSPTLTAHISLSHAHR